MRGFLQIGSDMNADQSDEATQLEQITDTIIAAAIRVHRTLGPGMLESAYKACLAFEIATRGLAAQREAAMPLTYHSIQLDCGYRVDIVVAKLVVVEVKAIERLERVHAAQVLSYLRMMNLKVGLLINFNVPLLRMGIKRVVNGFPG